jgi:hypothetical protein
MVAIDLRAPRHRSLYEWMVKERCLGRHRNKHTSECDTVLYAAPGVEVLHKRWFLETILWPQARILAILTHLRLAKDFNTQSVAERINPNKRCISFIPRTPVSESRSRGADC